jgi:hypothetical protein
MTDKQLYTLCGFIALSGAAISGSAVMYFMSAVAFASSISQEAKKHD